MTKKKNTNKKRAALSIFLIAALLITGAFAFLTATDSKTNVFTVGNVKIELIEKFDGETYNGGVDPKTENKVVEDIVPGQTIEKAPYVKNVGANKAYVYISVGIPVDNAQNVYTKNGTYTSKNELSIPVKAYAIQEGYKSKTNAEEIWNAYFDESVYDITEDDSKVELFELLHKGDSLEYINGINSNEWKEIAIYKTEDYNYHIYSYATENSEILLTNTQTENLFDAVKFNSGIGGRNPDDALLTLNYLTPNDSGSYEVIKSIEKEEGEEINELYSPNALAKTGYSLDWHINSPNGEIATAAYKVNDDTDLYGVYTNLVDADSDEEYEGAQYLTYAIGYNDDFGGLYAAAIGADDTHRDYPDEPTTVAVPANISVTLTESGVVTTPNGTIKGFANNEVFDPDEFNDDYADVDTEYLSFKNASPAGMYLANYKVKGLTLSYTDSTLNGQMNIGTTYKIPVKIVTQAWKDVYSEDEETDLLYSEYVTLHNITKRLVLPDSIRNISFTMPWFATPILESVNIPMNCIVLDANAFDGQKLLKYAMIGPNVKTISISAFDNCFELECVNIPDSVETIGVNAFGSCYNLQELLFGSNVKEIGDAAFNHCDSLTSITLPNSLKIIGENAFESCDALTNITIPNSVTRVGESAFASCDELKEVTIGNSVTEIENEAFRGCRKLSTVNYTGDKAIKIGRLAFDETSFIDEANWGADELLIGGNLVKAKGLSGTYETPSYIKGIAAEAFSKCKELTQLNISKNVEAIGGYLDFKGDITVSTDNKVYDSRNNCNAVIETMTNTLISAGSCVEIPDTVTKIGDSAFKNSFVEAINIPNSVTEIECDAFYDCSNLSSVILSDNIEKIKSSAFTGSKLSSITIPKSIKYIGPSAFSNFQTTSFAANYNGTVEEWNTFYNSGKQRNSYDIMPTGTIIQCTNGTVTYEY